MPLVRVEVRNEYALGAPELYREANTEDPKELLECVAVAGLVGILRQLGDLAEFAAEVFHSLQEEVMITSSRSHKLMARVQRVETALSPLEKALLAQRSHLHFSYTAGSNWHARIRYEQNHFIYSDMPHFIMDSYDDSRGPPSLHLLDRFDSDGPGSCLKRYSDPTFYKKASVESGEAAAKRIRKDTKGRNFKKGSWTRSREESQDASLSYNSGRMQFTQKNVDGHSSSSRSASTYDATQRSDLAKLTTSDLRNRSDYIEAKLCSVNSVQPEEHDSRKFISSLEMRQESAFLHYNFHEENINDAYDDIEIYPSQEQTGCSSSPVIRDKKNKKLYLETQDSDNEGMKHVNNHNNRRLETFSLDLDPQTLCHNDVAFEIVDNRSCDQAVAAPESSDGHLDDVDSETDDFMDALNFIDSECETVKLEDKGVDEGASEVITDDLDLNSESNVLADSSLIDANCGNNLILSPKSLHGATRSNIDEFNSVKYFQPCEMAKYSSIPGSPHFQDDNNVESVVACAITSNFRGDNPEMPITHHTRMGLESEEHVPETSNVTSSTFWTNGGLLGLQPSKPPDFSLSNALNNKDARQTKKFQQIEEEDQENGTSFRKIPPADLDIKLGKLRDSFHQSNNADITRSGVTLSRNFELSNEFLSTGSRKKLILPDDRNSPIEQRHHPTVAIRTFPESPILLSPSSSPPLAHMKISFEPLDGFRTSKLKLKFPDRNNTNSDIFPLFQLVPEVSVSRHNNVLDSDADTFYRSSPSLSDDDSHSNQSESNSEQWESSESTTNKDRDLYDALRRISLTESVPTVLENSLQNYASCRSSDVQSLCAKNDSFVKALQDDINIEGFVETPFVTTPAPPPPLPPAEWQKSGPSHNGSCYEFRLTRSVSMISQPKTAPFSEDQIDTTNLQNIKKMKSFNLRPTVTTKPTVPSAGSVNYVRVNAMLDKANAIRQAVGSDGEDDGNWSEA